MHEITKRCTKALMLFAVVAVSIQWLKIEVLEAWSHPARLADHGVALASFVAALVVVILFAGRGLRVIERKSPPVRMVLTFIRLGRWTR